LIFFDQAKQFVALGPGRPKSSFKPGPLKIDSW
jgi:hypothetical protein